MNQPLPPYRTSNGIWMTQSLFYEQAILREFANRVYDPVFSLMHDKPGLINARKTFVELGDPTGYAWAMKYLGDYQHWKKLMKAKWFQEAYNVWMDELNTKLKSEAMQKIRDIAASDDKGALPAARWLAQEEYNKQKRAGRPTKEAIDAELKKAMQTASVEDEDAERIGLKVVK